MISKQIKLLEYGKETLNDIKKYIEGNAFVKNQKIIKNKIEDLYNLTKYSC